MTSPVSRTYCTPEDILLGDLQPPRTVSIPQWIQASADEMNSYLGQIYELPIELDETRPDHLPDILLLRKINAYLTTGKILMTLTAAWEDKSVHAYGKSMYDEARQELTRITAGRTVIEAGIPLAPEDTQPNGPLVLNVDPQSYVNKFYGHRGSAHADWTQWGVGIDG